MNRARELTLLLVLGLAFGVLVAVVKGQDTGVRDALGNTSAPWVVFPFIAGSRFQRIWHAALVGVAVTLAAFLGFYLAEAAILDLGPHPWYVDLRLTLGSGRVYEKWGLLSGSFYGALGGVWASRRLVVAPIAVGLAFLAEPVVVWLLGRRGLWAGDELYFQHAWMWIGEVLLGLGCILLAVLRAPTRTARPA